MTPKDDSLSALEPRKDGTVVSHEGCVSRVLGGTRNAQRPAGEMPTSPLTPSTDSKWRELLWLNHGCPVFALYGDDGEMQCGRCCIDFRRMTPDAIANTWRVRNLRALARAFPAPVSDLEEGDD